MLLCKNTPETESDGAALPPYAAPTLEGAEMGARSQLARRNSLASILDRVEKLNVRGLSADLI